MDPQHHPQHPVLATLAALATASGGIAEVRDTVHLLAGIWGDCAGVAVSLLTLAWWIRIWLTRHRPPPRPWPRPGRSQD